MNYEVKTTPLVRTHIHRGVFCLRIQLSKFKAVEIQTSFLCVTRAGKNPHARDLDQARVLLVANTTLPQKLAQRLKCGTTLTITKLQTFRICLLHYAHANCA